MIYFTQMEVCFMAHDEVIKEVDKRESLRVVTKNEFITAPELATLTLKARKLLYLAVAQCKVSDKEFYEYRVPVPEFAEMMGIDSSNVYRTADKLTDELMKSFIRVQKANKHFAKYSLFSKCEYEEDGELYFKLNKDMTDLLLSVNGNFSKPLLSDFMKMKSPYSMAIWHLFQREMKSKLPWVGNPIYFELSLEELRTVTGTADKKTYDILNNFKIKVLDKAIREIKDNQLADISYTNKKKGRTVVGFVFKCSDWLMGDRQPTERTLKKMRKIELWKISKQRPLTKAEDDEYQELILELDQMTLADYENGVYLQNN